jgi:prolyl 4-hydroxylase
MVYLNDDFSGDETEFLKLNLKIIPKKGSAPIWNNLYRDGFPNTHTLHQAHPVHSGEKYIITKWFRVGSTQTR